MTIDIEESLREQATTVGLNRSVDDIFTRGDRLRRRRRTHALVGGGLAATVALLAGSVMLPPGSTPVVAPAVASWSGGTTNLTPGELHTVTDLCLDHMSGIDDGTMPLAAESRNGTVIAYFRSGSAEANCVVKQRQGGPMRFDSSSASDDVPPLPAGTNFGFIGLGTADPGVRGGPLTSVWGTTEVSADVARMTCEMGGETFDATVVDGVMLLWVTGTFTSEQVDDAVFTAYDADGHALPRVGPPNHDRGH